VISGVGDGLGGDAARLFAREGARVVMLARQADLVVAPERHFMWTVGKNCAEGHSLYRFIYTAELINYGFPLHYGPTSLSEVQAFARGSPVEPA
jgi:NAD(P)-dependent dehydrogenase (short-subunit alcohol dehydrogenase family)